MWMLLKIAGRNLRRHLRRTLITASSIAFGLAFLVVGSAMGDGAYRDMVEGAVSMMAGHVVVHGEGYHEERDAKIVVRDATARAARLREAFPDATVVPRVFLSGLLTSPTGATGVSLTAVEPALEREVGDFDDKLVDGAFLGDDKTDILIGATLADSLGVQVGDKIVLMMQSGADVESLLFRVKGIYRTGIGDVDGFFALITIPAAQQLLGVTDAVSQLGVLLPADDEDHDELRAAATAAAGGDGIEVLSWPEALPEVYEYIVLDMVGMWVMLGVIILMAAIGVLNTVLMSVLERVREFGVMLSLGMSRQRLAGIVLLESLLIGIVAGVIGLGLGLAASYPLVVNGLDVSELMGAENLDVAGVSMSAMLYGYIKWPKILVFTLLTIAVTVLAGLYPVWWVSRLTPIKAMTHR